MRADGRSGVNIGVMLLLFLWLGVVGFVVGALGRLLVPGPNRMTMTLTILIGLVGSFVGGLGGNAVFGRPWGFVLSVVVAALLVSVVDRSPVEPPRA
jgi:uncharacterized membrane protein YeaQ/YmgE (transglycosylase-associated protein family)